MPLLEITQTRQISASIRLTDTVANQVDQYAAFIHASADDVVEQALAYVFSKDRDFQDFLRSPEARQVASTLRIRKAPVSEAVNASVDDARERRQKRFFCGGVEGVIRPQHPRQNHCGASHRKKIDTPPLRGSCKAAKWYPN